MCELIHGGAGVSRAAGFSSMVCSGSLHLYSCPLDSRQCHSCQEGLSLVLLLVSHFYICCKEERNTWSQETHTIGWVPGMHGRTLWRQFCVGTKAHTSGSSVLHDHPGGCRLRCLQVPSSPWLGKPITFQMLKKAEGILGFSVAIEALGHPLLAFMY